MDPNEKCARIVSLMVLEKHVFVRQEMPSSLIHYLCTYPSMQGKGYATKFLKMVFDQDSMYNKVVYAVMKFPPFHIPNFGKIKMKSDDV